MSRLICGATTGWVRSADPRRLFDRRECGQVVGLRSWLDASGDMRAACYLPGHTYDVERRHGRYPGEHASDELAAASEQPWDADEAYADSRCCGAGSSPHWVYCPERTVESPTYRSDMRDAGRGAMLR